MKSSERNARLKARLDGRCLVAPGAYDALSAKLLEENAFEVAYVGSYGTAASGFGFPDVGLLSLDELVTQARRVVGAVSLPVIADAEGGFHPPASIWRTVRAFEEAGVSAIHIEDHAGGKHTDLPQHLIPLDEMLAKLRAALDARVDPSFQIIARTDAVWATKDEEEAVRRVNAFADLGVDMVFPTGASIATIARLKAANASLRVVAIETPESEAYAKHGAADLVLHYGFCLYAATKAIGDALKQFRQRFDPASVADRLESVAVFEERCDYRSFTARTRHYGK